MTDLRTAAQQALEALEICAVRQEHQWHGLQQVQIVKAALRAALEQPEQPVAWRFRVHPSKVPGRPWYVTDNFDDIRMMVERGDWEAAPLVVQG